ncbi:MAG: hypothetical protein B6I20_08520 [Bacteroidetes bacterium 4572_117]|nr:MAG: hypothetical protein B6I20_08520 [Bacteroidetes bacterium 4572_117]
MKKFIFLFIVLVSPLLILAQETEKTDSTLGWNYTGVGTLSFSQVAFTNWAAGGENSLALNGLAIAGADLKTKAYIWENDIILNYGMQKQGEQEFRKSTDKIEFSTKFGYHAVKNWYYSGLLGFKTQFSKGYEYNDNAEKTLVSDLMSPGYLNIAIGMNYKPSKEFTLFVGPISGRTTFVSDTILSVKYGVEAHETIRNEFGGIIKASLKKDVMKNVNLTSQLSMFSNYVENPQNIDVDLQVIITMKVNKYLSANLHFQFLYDDDIMIADENGYNRPALQVKELFGLGITYKLK